MQATAHAGDGQGRTSALGFGPFELDLRAGELRKAGRRIRLQEQPFQILRMLLESPGEVVLREEIRSRLWPDDTSSSLSTVSTRRCSGSALPCATRPASLATSRPWLGAATASSGK